MDSDKQRDTCRHICKHFLQYDQQNEVESNKLLTLFELIHPSLIWCWSPLTKLRVYDDIQTFIVYIPTCRIASLIRRKRNISFFSHFQESSNVEHIWKIQLSNIFEYLIVEHIWKIDCQTYLFFFSQFLYL